MLAVLAPLDDVEAAARSDEKLDLVIANKNAPSQTRPLRPTAEIDRAAQAFGRSVGSARRGCRSRPPSTARSSPRPAGRSERRWKSAISPRRSRSSPTRRPASTRTSPTRPRPAGRQLARPVEFVAQVEAMALAGVRTFLEVGPGLGPDRLVRGDPRRAGIDGLGCIALDASGGTSPAYFDLAHALARLAARGHPVDLARWERRPDATRSRHQAGPDRADLRRQLSSAPSPPRAPTANQPPPRQTSPPATAPAAAQHPPARPHGEPVPPPEDVDDRHPRRHPRADPLGPGRWRSASPSRACSRSSGCRSRRPSCTSSSSTASRRPCSTLQTLVEHSSGCPDLGHGRRPLRRRPDPGVTPARRAGGDTPARAPGTAPCQRRPSPTGSSPGRQAPAIAAEAAGPRPRRQRHLA